MLRGQSVVDGEKTHVGVVRKATAQPIVRLNIANHKTSAMEVDHQTSTLVALGYVQPRREFSALQRQHAIARVDLGRNIATKGAGFVSKRATPLFGTDAQRRGLGILASES